MNPKYSKQAIPEPFHAGRDMFVVERTFLGENVFELIVEMPLRTFFPLLQKELPAVDYQVSPLERQGLSQLT